MSKFLESYFKGLFEILFISGCAIPVLVGILLPIILALSLHNGLWLLLYFLPLPYIMGNIESGTFRGD